MKIYVYAIAKNESKFAERWVKSMSEADRIYVLDTGSEDRTAEILKNNGVIVKTENVTPWRFDKARNLSLEMVPDDADICICTDLDEVFSSGWRAEFEKCAKQTDANLFAYHYVWNVMTDGSEGISFQIKKAHSRRGFVWKGIVHETLEAVNPSDVKEASVSNVTLTHYPDPEKSREQYLPLLEQAVREEPKNDRNAHYLGREYMFKGRYSEAIEVLKKHLSLPTSVWAEERCASMRYIARCYTALNDKNNAFVWLIKAVGEYPYSREPFIELARFFYSAKDYEGVIWAVKKALEITKPSQSYINDPICFSALPYDLLSIALYHTKRHEEALSAAEIASELSPNDERIASNCVFFRSLIDSERLSTSQSKTPHSE